MRIGGVPLWTLVLVACLVAPLVVRAWIDAEHRRAKKRTAELLQPIVGSRRGPANEQESAAAGVDDASMEQGAHVDPGDPRS